MSAPCVHCQREAGAIGERVDWWCWMFGCSLACDCYGREQVPA